jgi:hypothetical protein
MKLSFIEHESDFIGLDLIPDGDEDRLFCREINKAFKAGDLHMRIDKSCLVIEYDGESRSFPIKQKECEMIEKSLNAVFNGTIRFLIGSMLVYDSLSKEYYCICILRFLGKAKNENDSQQKLVKSYIPPLESNKKPNKNRPSLFIQRRLINEPFFIVNNRPLFKMVGKQSDQGKLIK